jgi:uncharacterized membrane protein
VGRVGQVGIPHLLRSPHLFTSQPDPPYQPNLPYPVAVLRGKGVSRLEGFSDAVFGFTITLLVVSLEVPENFAGLQRILTGFPAFAVTFTLICWVWFEHFVVFRRYSLEDGLTVLINCVLLFIVVFYAYPMKFMFTRLITGSMLGQGPGISEGMTAGEARTLMLVYSGGFVALFGSFALLYWNALRQREKLRLDVLAAFDARAGLRRHALSVAIGLLSMLIAIAGPITYLPLAGLIFILMGPAHGAYGYLNGRARDRLESTLCQPSGTPTPGTITAVASND